MLKQAAIIALLGLSTASFAGWQLKVGASSVAPSSDDNTLAGGVVTHAKVTQEFAFTPSVEYLFDNTPFSVELLLANPIKHDVKSDLGKIASFKELPPTLTVKYNFKNSTGFTPYVGVGATAVIPWSEKTTGPIAGTKLDAEVGYGVAGQVGFIFQPKDAKNWGVYVDVRYADVSSDLKLNGAKIGTLDVNPWVYTAGYSYKF